MILTVRPENRIGFFVSPQQVKTDATTGCKYIYFSSEFCF